VLARATLNGLAGRVVARGPPVAHPCFMTLPKSREHAHEASINNMASEDSLLSVIVDLQKVLIRFSLPKLLSELEMQRSRLALPEVQ